jgi:hypothetical protein
MSVSGADACLHSNGSEGRDALALTMSQLSNVWFSRADVSCVERGAYGTAHGWVLGVGPHGHLFHVAGSVTRNKLVTQGPADEIYSYYTTGGWSHLAALAPAPSGGLYWSLIWSIWSIGVQVGCRASIGRCWAAPAAAAAAAAAAAVHPGWTHRLDTLRVRTWSAGTIVTSDVLCSQHLRRRHCRPYRHPDHRAPTHNFAALCTVQIPAVLLGFIHNSAVKSCSQTNPVSLCHQLAHRPTCSPPSPPPPPPSPPPPR